MHYSDEDRILAECATTLQRLVSQLRLTPPEREFADELSTAVAELCVRKFEEWNVVPERRVRGIAAVAAFASLLGPSQILDIGLDHDVSGL